VTLRIMSDKELSRLEVLRDLDQQRLTAAAAAQLLGLGRRQTLRLLRAYRLRGADGLISRKRGRPSNRKTPADVRQAAIDIIKARYADFGPTLAAEKLRELHDITVSRETLRAWMVAEGLWIARKKRQRKIYQPRYRRDCVGELVQIDGSEHRWFEARKWACRDASRLMSHHLNASPPSAAERDVPRATPPRPSYGPLASARARGGLAR
jgi:hypothetical protein